jgi:uncharacterized membrane protein (UPF0127 family)
MRSRLKAEVTVFLAFVSLLPAACTDSQEKVVLSVAGRQITAEVARTESQREHGLMERRHLGLTEGMIFIFDRDQHLEFWMKNTPLPLSIAFISEEGKILEILDMQPFDLRTIRSRLSARYALEMSQGAFQRLGIKEGDVITFPQGFAR